MVSRLAASILAVERSCDTVMKLYGQVSGGMFGADENCRPGCHYARQDSNLRPPV